MLCSLSLYIYNYDITGCIAFKKSAICCMYVCTLQQTADSHSAPQACDIINLFSDQLCPLSNTTSDSLCGKTDSRQALLSTVENH